MMKPFQLVLLSLLAALGSLSGCGMVGVMAENYKRTSTHAVEAEYTGLTGRSFAVVVQVGQSIEGQHPGLRDVLLGKITEQLSANAGASGVVPAPQVAKYLYNHPGWSARSMVDLAKDLGGVERIVWVEIYEFRLNDVGNQYEWDGLAGGTFAVLEMDSVLPEARAFERRVQVKFPDKRGFGPNDYSASIVQTSLMKRFVDRSTWLCYTHEEPYYPDY